MSTEQTAQQQGDPARQGLQDDQREELGLSLMMTHEQKQNFKVLPSARVLEGLEEKTHGR